MRLVTPGGLAGVLGTLLVSTAAVAGVPSAPPWSTIPSRIALVGSRNGTPDSTLGRFTVYVTRFGVPRPNTNVVVDLTTAPGMRFASTQAPNPVTIDCTRRWASAYADANGIAAFTLVGSSSAAATPGPTQVRIDADGVLFGTIPVSAYDLDGANGVDGADLSIWARDYFSNQYYGRSDYDGDGALGPADLSMWAAALFAGGSSSSAPATCP